MVDGDIDLSERSAKRELSLSNLRTLSHVIYYTVGGLSKLGFDSEAFLEKAIRAAILA